MGIYVAIMGERARFGQIAVRMFLDKNFSKIFFKSDNADQRVFYPFGQFGRGYIVDATAESEIEAYLRKQSFRWVGAILVLIGTQSILSFDKSLVIVILALFFLFDYVRLKRLARGLPASTARITNSEIARSRARHISAVRVYAAVAGGIVMTLAGVFIALCAHGLDAWFGALGALLFGYWLVQALLIVRARWQMGRASEVGS